MLPSAPQILLKYWTNPTRENISLFPWSICKTPSSGNWRKSRDLNLCSRLLVIQKLCFCSECGFRFGQFKSVPRIYIQITKNLIFSSFPNVPNYLSKLMILHLWSNSQKEMIHICKKRTCWENDWICWNLGKGPNLKCWRTFKEDMVNQILIRSTSCTTYISLHLSCLHILLNCYTPWYQLPKKMFYFWLTPYFPTKCLQNIYCKWWSFLICVDPLYLVSWFKRKFFIVCEMPSLPINHLISAQWYTFYDFHILWVYQSP